MSGTGNTTIICENESDTIGCVGTAVLSILSANYGRTSRDICIHSAMGSINCHASNSLSVITDLCQDETACTITPSNSMFGDPCSGVFKYLEVRYDCQSTGKILRTYIYIYFTELNCTVSSQTYMNITSNALLATIDVYMT